MTDPTPSSALCDCGEPTPLMAVILLVLGIYVLIRFTFFGVVVKIWSTRWSKSLMEPPVFKS